MLEALFADIPTYDQLQDATFCHLNRALNSGFLAALCIWPFAERHAPSIAGWGRVHPVRCQRPAAACQR
jgi:hypothetical protein